MPLNMLACVVETMCDYRDVGTTWVIPRSRVLLKKLIVRQTVTKFPACYATRNFTTVCTKVCRVSVVLSQTSTVQDPPAYSRKILFNIILSSMPTSPDFSFCSVFTTKILCAFDFLISRATWPHLSHRGGFDQFITFCEKYELRTSSRCRFLQPRVTSTLGPNTFLSTTLWNTLVLWSPINAKNNLSQTCEAETQFLHLTCCDMYSY